MVDARRAIVREFGRASGVVKLETVSLPPLDDDKVRIRLTARSINPSDLITISGAYPSRTSLPFVPGFEAAGIVEEIGAAVRNIKCGMRVLPVGTAGGWQDFKDTTPDWCLPLPDALSDEQAACSYVNPMTAWLMMTEVAGLKPGDRIAITAAGSAIGRMLVAIANAGGIRPFALVRSSEAEAGLSGLDAIVIHGQLDRSAAAMLMEHSGPQSLHKVFDCVGGPEAQALATCLKPAGQFIHYGLLSGLPIPTQIWNDRPDMRFHLFHLRQWVHTAPRERLHAAYAEVTSLIASGRLTTAVRSRHGLADISAALADAETLSACGKVLLIDR